MTKKLEKPLKRVEIAKNLNVTSGSISSPLNKLLDLALLDFENEKYQISDFIFKAWLKNEYEKRGVFPYRSFQLD